MPESAKKALRAFAAIISLIALIAIVHLGWNQLRDAASLHRHWLFSWIVAAVLSQIVVYSCIAGMFKLSLSSHRKVLSPGFLIYCAFAFLFANRSLPGPAVAGVATLVYLMRGKRIPPVDAQAAAGSFYFADYAGFFTLIAAVAVPLLVNQPNHTARIAYLVGLSIIGVTAVMAVAAFARPLPLISVVARTVGFAHHTMFPSSRNDDWGAAVHHALVELHARIVSVAKSPSDVASYYFLSVGMHAAEVATVLFGAHAAGIALSAPAGAASYVAGNLASIVSVLPGAIGFYEAGMIGTMHVAGHLSLGDAAVCALTYRLLSFWAPLPVVANVLFKVSREGMSGLTRTRHVNSS